MRYLALDWGKTHVGVAKGDDGPGIAFPAGVILNTGKLFEELQALSIKEGAEAFVVGIPLTLRGTHGPQAQEVLIFIERLEKTLSLPVFVEDERFTTKIASRLLGTARRTHADTIAASLILQSFFDKKKRQEPSI